MTPDAPLPASALASLFDPEVAIAVAVPALVGDELYPDERRHVARAVEKRKAQFGTARVCARRALAQLGVAPCSLVPNADRSPRWPPGVVGTIAHTHGCCAVAVTTAPGIDGLGLDVERDTPLDPKLERKICTDAERRWLDGRPRDDRGWLAKLFFSAKEAFYKCQYPTTRTWLGFQDVELAIDFAPATFSVAAIRPQGDPWDRVRRMRGRWLHEAGLIVTAATLTSPPQ